MAINSYRIIALINALVRQLQHTAVEKIRPTFD